MVSVRNVWGPLFQETGLWEHSIQKRQIYNVKVSNLSQKFPKCNYLYPPRIHHYTNGFSKKLG